MSTLGAMSPALPINYRGVERRRHITFVTQNTEYHFRDGLCIAVKDRQSGDWLPGHLALHRTISGGMTFCANGAIRPNIGTPKIGESLFFGTGGRDLVTSPLLEVQRPNKTIVASYPRSSKMRSFEKKNRQG